MTVRMEQVLGGAIRRILRKTVFQNPIFFREGRTAFKDSLQGSLTASHQPPTAVNRQSRAYR